jgi:hypothetical protein
MALLRELTNILYIDSTSEKRNSSIIYTFDPAWLVQFLLY